MLEQIAGRVDGRVLEGAEHAAAEDVARSVEKGLQGEGAAAEIAVGERQRNQLVAVGRRIAGGGATHRGSRNAGRAIAADAHIIGIALEVEAVGDQFEPGAVGQLVAETAEDRPAVAVLDLALGAVDADAVAMAVEESAAPFQRRAEAGVELAGAIADQAAGLAAESLALKIVAGRPLQQYPPAQPVAGRRADQHLVDNAAGGANALERVRTVDQLDPVDEKRVDCVAIARTVADRRRLRHAVDREQRRAAAQAFAGAAEFLPCRREGRGQRRDGVDGRTVDRNLIGQLLAVYDIDRDRQGTDRQLGAGGGDDDRLVVIGGIPAV